MQRTTARSMRSLKKAFKEESQSNNRPRVSSVHPWRAGRLVLKPWPAWMLEDCCRWLCGSASNHSDPKKLTESLTKQHHSWFYRLDHRTESYIRKIKKKTYGSSCVEIFIFIKGILSRVNTQFQVQYFKAYAISPGQFSSLLLSKVVISHSHRQKMGEHIRQLEKEHAWFT